MSKRGSIALARSLCYEIAGPTDEDDDIMGNDYGSVDIAEILSAEVVRLRDGLRAIADHHDAMMRDSEIAGDYDATSYRQERRNVALAAVEGITLGIGQHERMTDEQIADGKAAAARAANAKVKCTDDRHGGLRCEDPTDETTQIGVNFLRWRCTHCGGTGEDTWD
jgi:hypothetical protein